MQERSGQTTLASTVTLAYVVLRRHNRSVENRSKELLSWTGLVEGCTFQYSTKSVEFT